MPGLLTALVALVMPAASPAGAQSAPATITMASTTSTEQSGFFRYLLPLLETATGVRVRVVAVGTGQAIDICRRGDADLALTHDRIAEEKALAEGWFSGRTEVMYNDFLLAGPAEDPAAVGGGRDVLAAFARLAVVRPPFVSRGDNSGTHAAELRFWGAAGVDLPSVRGPWYRETGSGMGPALNTASALGAYVLTDRATWISFRNRGPLVPLVEGDPRMFNQYAVLPVDPKRHPHVQAAAAAKVVAWLTSPAGQRAIAGFRLGGQQLYYPNAAAPRGR